MLRPSPTGWHRRTWSHAPCIQGRHLQRTDQRPHVDKVATIGEHVHDGGWVPVVVRLGVKRVTLTFGDTSRRGPGRGVWNGSCPSEKPKTRPKQCRFEALVGLESVPDAPKTSRAL